MTDEELEVNSPEEDEDFVDLVDDKGRHLKFFHVGSTEFQGKWYAFFMPAEVIEGLGEDEVVIFEVKKADDSDEEVLLPVEDEAVLENVYEQFCREMDEEAEAEEAAELECGCGCGSHHHHHGCCCEEDEDEEEDDHCGCGCCDPHNN